MSKARDACARAHAALAGGNLGEAYGANERGKAPWPVIGLPKLSRFKICCSNFGIAFRASTKVDTMGCNKKDRHTEAQVRAERNGQDSSCPYVTYRNFAQSENGGFNTSWGKRYSSLAGEENPPKRFVARVIIEPLSCDALSRRAHRGEGGRVQPPRGSFHV